MLRKLALVIVAVGSLGVATLTPTPASAWRGGWYGGWGWGWGGGWGGPGAQGSRLAVWLGASFGGRPGAWAPGWQVGWGPAWGWGPGWRSGWAWSGPRYVAAPGFYGSGCLVRRWVRGPWGPRRILVNRCW